MKETEQILECWDVCEQQGETAVLATVVKVEGSAYRRPGARLLLSPIGQRAGSISGGCLEGDLAKKAWWWTEQGPALRVYDTRTDDDAAAAFGLGCNGIVTVWLERLWPGRENLPVRLLREVKAARQPGVLATVLEGAHRGQRAALLPDGSRAGSWGQAEMETVLQEERSRVMSLDLGSGPEEVFVECVAPPLELLLVGAGDDARPVAQFAKELGWRVTVLDGRSHLATRARFPQADEVLVSEAAEPLRHVSVTARTAAVIMAHSVEQDQAALRTLLPLRLRYIGILGPRRRTEKMLAPANVEDWPTLHSPMGLDVGAEGPDEIALSIIAEVQAAVRGRSGQRLRTRGGPIHQPQSAPAV